MPARPEPIRTGTDPDPEIPLSLARHFGLSGHDRNWLADDTGLTSLTVREDGIRQHYIPYTNRAINWHTDGYYNPPDRHVHQSRHQLAHRWLLQPAGQANPGPVAARGATCRLGIPARITNGKIARREETGPVFRITPEGNLHMRYTIRLNNVIWADDPLTHEAVAALEAILNSDTPYILRGLLEPGMGLVSNNVLHDRAAFTDDAVHKRHYYRARYYQRLAGTGLEEIS